MNALARIKDAGFEIWLKDNGNIGVRPFDALTAEQLAFIKTHKAEIIEALAANDAKPEPAPPTDPLVVTVWTPSGTPMPIRADNAEHADWLRQMNTKPANPTPKPTTPEPDADRISEAGHNADGRFFMFLATWPDGSQCYLCQMPRMTVDEMLAQYPTATHIEPIENEEYPND